MLAGEYVSSGNLEFRVAEQKAAYYARAPKLLDRLREDDAIVFAEPNFIESGS